jgi:uncharacterized membrane protein
MSYLDNALNYPDVTNYSPQFVNDVAGFFGSRVNFLFGIIEKVVDFVSSFFKLVVLDTIPAILDVGSGRQNAVRDLQNMFRDFFKDIPVGIVGLILGSNIASKLNDEIHAKVQHVYA